MCIRDRSSTTKVDTSRIVCVPVTNKSPPIVTVDPSSWIILLASWILPVPPSHFNTVLSTRLVLFLREIFPPLYRIPPSPVIAAPLSVLTELISIVVTPPDEDWEIDAAPAAVNLKSPAKTALEPEASLVIVFVSVLSIVIVDPVWDSEEFVPPTKVSSPEVRVPGVPPLRRVTVSGD